MDCRSQRPLAFERHRLQDPRHVLRAQAELIGRTLGLDGEVTHARAGRPAHPARVDALDSVGAVAPLEGDRGRLAMDGELRREGAADTRQLGSLLTPW